MREYLIISDHYHRPFSIILCVCVYWRPVKHMGTYTETHTDDTHSQERSIISLSLLQDGSWQLSLKSEAHQWDVCVCVCVCGWHGLAQLSICLAVRLSNHHYSNSCLVTPPSAVQPQLLCYEGSLALT